jgi:hypothetical protein
MSVHYDIETGTRVTMQEAADIQGTIITLDMLTGAPIYESKKDTMNTEQIIQALDILDYTLELRSPSFFHGDQYAARFDNWEGETCDGCGAPLPRAYPSYEHADTFEEAIIEAAKEIITRDKLDIDLEDGLKLGISKMDTERAVEDLRQQGYLFYSYANAPTGRDATPKYAAAFRPKDAPYTILHLDLIKYADSLDEATCLAVIATCEKYGLEVPG